MRISKLQLTNFRNYRTREFEFDDVTTVIVGRNTAGKTNILEAVNLLATGESFREGKVEEMVRWEEEVAHVQGRVEQDVRNNQPHFTKASRGRQDTNKVQETNFKKQGDETIELQVTLTRGEVQGKRVSRRRYLVNGVARQKRAFVGNLTVVVFRPEDLRIVEGSPGRRRRFLDEVLTQVDSEYARSLGSYNRGLVRRNKLLGMIREGKTRRSALEFWDRLIVKDGGYLQEMRMEMVEAFNSMNNEQETMNNELRMEYDRSVISQKRLEQYADKEVWAGHTLVGPHRDDFKIMSNEQETVNNEDGRDLAVYGSRGEQRMAVLWLKVRALGFVEEKKKERPVLMLDDIFSELDHEHREMVFGLMGGQQTIVTTADEHYIEGLRKVWRIDL